MHFSVIYPESHAPLAAMDKDGLPKNTGGIELYYGKLHVVPELHPEYQTLFQTRLPWGMKRDSLNRLLTCAAPYAQKIVDCWARNENDWRIRQKLTKFCRLFSAKQPRYKRLITPELYLRSMPLSKAWPAGRDLFDAVGYLWKRAESEETLLCSPESAVSDMPDDIRGWLGRALLDRLIAELPRLHEADAEQMLALKAFHPELLQENELFWQRNGNELDGEACRAFLAKYDIRAAWEDIPLGLCAPDCAVYKLLKFMESQGMCPADMKDFRVALLERTWELERNDTSERNGMIP